MTRALEGEGAMVDTSPRAGIFDPRRALVDLDDDSASGRSDGAGSVSIGATDHESSQAADREPTDAVSSSGPDEVQVRVPSHALRRLAFVVDLLSTRIATARIVLVSSSIIVIPTVCPGACRLLHRVRDGYRRKDLSTALTSRHSCRRLPALAANAAGFLGIRLG
jgi:hypothetical protein